MIELNKIYHCDNLYLMPKLPDESINVILTDPPYLYLKNQKLDRPFDEQMFFSECKRVLKKDGFIVLFGRGTSFYRWNTILDDLKFKFKEEIVWDKGYCTSPLMNISRVHETVSIHTKFNGTINKVKVPYLEMKGYDIDGIVTDIKRLKTTFKNTKSLNDILEFLENNKIEYCTPKYKYRVGQQGDYEEIVNRGISVMKAIRYGMNEKSIINESRCHYSSIHPTQKPVRLLERLIALVSHEGGLVLDPFCGSGSTAEACINQCRKYICCEIDKEYFNVAVNRINNVPKNLFA